MLKGYDDFGKHTKICHMRLRALISGNRVKRSWGEKHKHLNWGKRSGNTGCLVNYPYSVMTDNGHQPIARKPRD